MIAMEIRIVVMLTELAPTKRRAIRPIKKSSRLMMSIRQALRLLGVENERQLAKSIGIKYQRLLYWRDAKGGKLPYPFPEVIKARLAK